MLPFQFFTIVHRASRPFQRTDGGEVDGPNGKCRHHQIHQAADAVQNPIPNKKAGKLILAGCPLDHCPGVMIVYGFKIHGLDSEPLDEFVGGGFLCNAANKILDENGIVICALSHGLFIRALEQAVKLRAGRLLGEAHHVLDPHRLFAADG